MGERLYFFRALILCSRAGSLSDMKQFFDRMPLHTCAEYLNDRDKQFTKFIQEIVTWYNDEIFNSNGRTEIGFWCEHYIERNVKQ